MACHTVRLIDFQVVASDLPKRVWTAYATPPLLFSVALGLGMTLASRGEAGLVRTLLATIIVVVAISGVMHPLRPLLGGGFPSSRKEI